MKKVKKLYGKIQEQIPDCRGFLAQTWILIDFLRCKLKYHVGFEEYRQYSFYKLKDNAKKEYVTEYDVIHVIPKRFNNSSKTKIVDDKKVFNQFFNDLL